MIDKKEIPKHWQWKKLGEVADYLNGRAFKPTEWEKEGIPIIRIQNLNKAISNYNYTQKEFEDKYKVVKGDLLFAWSASLGVYIWNKEKAWLNQHIFKVVPKEICDKKFLFYTLDIITADLYAKTHGSGMVHVTKGKFEETAIPFPPLKEQQAIVSKIEELLSDLENGKQQLQTAQQQLKVYRQSLLKWAFEGRLTNKNLNGELPKGWKRKMISEVCEMKAGFFVKSSDIKDDFEVGLHPCYGGNGLRGYVNSSTHEGTFPLVGRQGALCGNVHLVNGKFHATEHAVVVSANEQVEVKWLYYKLISMRLNQYSSGVAQPGLSVNKLLPIGLSVPPKPEQQLIVEELESKLTICDKIEETISNALQKAEMLRQSILKKAFEGKLVVPIAIGIGTEKREAKVIPLYKPKSEYFYQVRLLASILKKSKQQQIEHGEMTLAKNVYLLDKIYDIPSFYEYQRLHLGPYPPAMKKAINNKQYFRKSENHIDVLNEKALFKSVNPFQEQIENALNELIGIFSKYEAKVRSHKTELLATVCKVVEDIQTTNLKAVRKSMAEWQIDLKDKRFKTKAEKFAEKETQGCLVFIEKQGWDKKLIK